MYCFYRFIELSACCLWGATSYHVLSWICLFFDCELMMLPHHNRWIFACQLYRFVDLAGGWRLRCGEVGLDEVAIFHPISLILRICSFHPSARNQLMARVQMKTYVPCTPFARIQAGPGKHGASQFGRRINQSLNIINSNQQYTTSTHNPPRCADDWQRREARMWTTCGTTDCRLLPL